LRHLGLCLSVDATVRWGGQCLLFWSECVFLEMVTRGRKIRYFGLCLCNETGGFFFRVTARVDERLVFVMIDIVKPASLCLVTVLSFWLLCRRAMRKHTAATV